LEWITTSTILRDLRDYENHAAWQKLAARFRKPIVAFVRGMGFSSADADDVAQEALLAFAESFRKQQFDPARGRLSNWLFGIAYRQAMGHKRREGRHPLPGGAGANTTMLGNLPDEQSASAVWDREWEQALLRQCLEHVRGEIEPTTYAAFDLVVCQEMDATKAAEQLGVPIKTVYNAKHRVLKRVRELRAELERID